ERMPDSGYMRAKVNQEGLIKAGGVPYTIVRATQFFEFLGGIADSGAEGDTVRLSTAPMQPLAADDVAATLADVAVAAPLNATVEVAGPEALSIAEFVGRFLAARGDKRTVIADPRATYYGAVMGSRGIAPGANPRLGPTRFEEWFRRSVRGAAERRVSNGRLRSGFEPTGSARIHRPARPERGARTRAIRRRMGAVRIGHPAVAHLRGDRRTAGAA